MMSTSKKQSVKEEKLLIRVTGGLQAFRLREPEHFLLKVESFSESKFERYESDEFEVGGYKWRLILYPKGDRKRNGSNHISLYLSISDTKTVPRSWEVNADFNLFVYNHVSEKYLTYKLESATRFNWLKTESGFAQLLPLDYFKERSNGYLCDDTCVFGAEVFGAERSNGYCWYILIGSIVVSPVKVFFIWGRKKGGKRSMCSSKIQSVKEEVPSDQVAELQALRLREPEHFLLKVESFSESNVERYESDEFEVGGYTWRLILYPKGDKKRNGSNHISLYLSITDTKPLPPGWEVNADFNLFVYNYVSEKYLTYKWNLFLESATRFNWLKTESGFAQLLPLDYFKESSNGYLCDDTCVFGAEVIVTSTSVVAKRQTLSMRNTSDNKIFSWTVGQFSKKDGILYSDKFEIGELQWKLRLHPKGNLDFKDKSISLYLKAEDDELKLAANWKAYAEYKVRIRNQLNTNHVEEQVLNHMFSSSSPSWGSRDFMPLSDVNDKSKGFVVNDTLVVEVEFTISSMIKNLNERL